MHRRKHRRSKARVARGALFFVALVSVAVAWWQYRPARGQSDSAANSVSKPSTSKISWPAIHPWQDATKGMPRQVYGHSVVPGGIHSVDELMAV